MKYIKKVSVAQLQSNTGTIIDSMTSGDDPTTNAPSIHAAKDYVDNKVDNKGYAFDYGSVTSEDTNTGTTFKKYGSTITITTHGRPVVIIGTAFGRVSGGSVIWKVALDGNIINSPNLMGTNSSTNTRVVGFMVLSDVPAGTHTLQLSYAANFANNTATMATYNNHSICAFEI